jgi:orotate phosphoribosyltransferase
MDNLIAGFRTPEEYERECKWFMRSLYREKYILTLWNTEDEEKRREGWILKGRKWSPWFFNMRAVGGSPELFKQICIVMGNLLASIRVMPIINHVIGVEMAGIPLASAAWFYNVRSAPGRGGLKLGYTRPLPEKTRTLSETWEKYQAWTKNDPAGYGQKSWVEGRIASGDNIAIFDDMSSDLESKLIARFMVMEEARKLQQKVQCNHLIYFLNRNKGTREKALAFSGAEQQFYPHQLFAHYYLEFSDHLAALASDMNNEEYQIIGEYQDDQDKFQNEKTQQKILALVN